VIENLSAKFVDFACAIGFTLLFPRPSFLSVVSFLLSHGQAVSGSFPLMASILETTPAFAFFALLLLGFLKIITTQIDLG